jgi:hypothetical protein
MTSTPHAIPSAILPGAHCAVTMAAYCLIVSPVPENAMN